jgi:hypothetical protein|tara:strand:- start:1533 stop:1985 length:453 start_codon:yes stop_codon:yes gene_type:complete
MANRVLLGKGTSQRGGTNKFGLWVSKPGQDVLTCADDKLTFDMDKGGSADIKGMFQLQTVTGTATASATTTISAGATVNLSFTNFNWGFGVIPFLGLSSTSTGAQTGFSTGRFSINSFSTSAVNVTNLTSNATLAVSFSVMPSFSNNARF